MKNTMPKTPFATRLSGSAKETQLRLRSIFQWKKQRPPVWLFAAVIVVMFGCLGLVSCQPEKPEEPNAPVEENASGDKYGDFFANYQSEFGGYQYTGYTNFAFDDRRLTLQDVPESLAEEQVLMNYYFAASFAFDGLLAIQGSESLKISAQNEAKNAGDGIYFTDVTIHSLDVLSEEDFTPSGSYFTEENQVQSFVAELRERAGEYGLEQYSVVCADLSWQWSEQALAMGPQLGDGRYERLYLVGKISKDANWLLYECFWGEYTLDRAYSEQDAMDALAMGELFTASNVSDVAPVPEGKLLVAPAAEGLSFTAAYFTERGSYELVIAIWDAETNSIVGTPFRAANSGGTPKVEIHEWQGEQRLLYTANGANQGITGGQAGEVALRDGEMTWLWPVQGDIRDLSRDSAGQPYQDYLDYWDNHFALLIPGGFEIFNENEEFGFYEGSPQQWAYSGGGISYPNSRSIVDSDREQVRAWLEEFGRDGNNGMDRRNDSASWRILELGRNDLTENCVLLCVSEFNEDIYLRVRMRMDHFGQKPIEILDWEIGGTELKQYPVEVEKIDQVMYARVEEMLENVVNARWMQENTNYSDFDQMKKPEFRDGDIITFRPIASYTDMYPNSVTYLYDLEIGLVCKHPENITLAGGNWVDGFGRLRNKYLLAYMVIEERNGQIVAVNFLAEDELYILGDDEGGAAAQRKMTKAALDPVRRDDIDIDETGKPILTDFFENVYHANRAYFLGEEPGAPREDDLRIDSVRFLGSEVTYETTGEAYLVRASVYNERLESADGQPVTKWWPLEQEYYFVLGRAMDNELYEVRGQRYYMGDSVEHMILEESYGVSDWDVTLWHDDNPYPRSLALGRWNANALDFVEGEPSVEILDGWEPIYQDGDYWDRCTLDGLSVLRYYNSVEDRHGINKIELTRDDFATLRGIRVGSTRADVMAAYPEAVENNYWGQYPDDLPLCWYANPEADLGPDILGPAILFFFEGDTVKQITLNDMFN